MIRCDQLTKKYGKTLALNALDLHIGAGELHGFVGPNGAGKTTLMRILATLMRPTSGDAWINQVSVNDQPETARAMVGYMPDFFGVYDNLKAWEYLDLYAGCLRIGEKERRRRIDELLELTALSDKREAYVDGLSRGMKQRLCLARALLHNPELLILDEPASGMDPRARAQMCEILKEVRASGKTVLISSHILPELSKMCSHVTILERGKAIFSGSVEGLAQKMKLNQALTVRFASKMDDEKAERLYRCITQQESLAVKRETPLCWQIQCDEADRDEMLLRKLVEWGAPICDYHRERATLENVFLEVTGNESQSDL